MTPGAVVADKYRLEGKLGEGSMGSVWAATHLALETSVAIKLMTWIVVGDDEDGSSTGISSRDRSVDRRARFEREAKAAAQIRSANVVQVFDYGVHQGVPFIVMERLVGEDLNKRLKREKRLTPAVVARLVRPIARALQRAHDVGLVHRDLKPANIFLAKEGDSEVPKIVDFGVVKAIRGEHTLGQPKSAGEDEDTVEGTIIGTPSYMSPEQAMGRADIDHRSDLWSFGVILFQALTGQKPFAGEAMFEALLKICSAPIPLATSIAPELPPGADAFFARAFERDVNQRFQSAREVEQAFYTLVSRPAMSIPPPEAPEAAAPTPPVVARGEWRAKVANLWSRAQRIPGTWLIGATVVVGLLAALLALGHGGTGDRTPAAAAASGATAPESASAAPPPPPVASAPEPPPPVASGTEPASVTASAAASMPVPASTLPRAPVHGHPAAPPHRPKRDLGY
jgi:serine/threonine-protein kinase